MTDGLTHKYSPGVFHRVEPAIERAPLVFDIPRSGRDFPNDFRSPAGFNEVKSSISMYVEELFEQAPEHGATWLYACFPNAFIDANRHEQDIDPDLVDGEPEVPFEPTEKSRLGVGLIHRVCDGTGAPLQQTPLSVRDVERRLQRYYWPYHDELKSILEGLHDEHGRAFHVSCHSMASVARPVSRDAGKPRSDFDIGDRDGSTCGGDFVDAVRSFLSGFGYDVTVNRHFPGAESIRKHGDPAAGIHSLQIETRRGLYMDEETYEKRAQFDTVRDHLGALAAHLAAFSRQ